MGFLTTGVPIYDLVIALVLGYLVAWFFTIRPLKKQLEEDGTRNFEADTELRTRNRSLDQVNKQIKDLQTKLSATEATLATTKEQLAKSQTDQDSAVEEKAKAVALADERANTLSADLEARTNTVNELQAKIALLEAEAKNAAILAENNQQRARLALLAAENDAMKYHITAKQLENQILRAQTGGMPYQMPSVPTIGSMPAHAQEAQYVPQNSDGEHHTPITG